MNLQDHAIAVAGAGRSGLAAAGWRCVRGQR